jgi:1-acyl-sn-glycerol-3-phosphate acyltransferase
MFKALRTLFGWLYFVWAFMTHYWVCTLFIKPFFKDVESRTHFASVPFLRWGARILGIKFSIEGVENIPKDEAFILTSNHQSLLDIAVYNIAIERKFSYLAKKELLKVPFLGTGLTMMGHFTIDRHNRKSAMETMKEVTRKVKDEDYSVLIFPEGTRSIDGNLGEFKKGAFMLAAETGAQILPAAIDGGYKVVNKSSWVVQGGEMKIKIGKPISVKPAENKVEQKALAKELSVSVKDAIQSLLDDLRAN